MQKNKLWIILVLIILFIGVLLFWLVPSQSNTRHTISQKISAIQNDSSTASPVMVKSNNFTSPSQQDTQVNCQLHLDQSNRLIVDEQTRNCFEYFLTQYGEKEIPQIKKDFELYIQQNYQEPTLSQVLDLWHRYLDYRQSTGELSAPNLDENDPQYYAKIFADTKNLRKRFFSNYEIEGLFGTEDTYNQYTINRIIIIGDKNLTEIQKAQKLKELFNQLPEDWKENLEQISTLENLRKLSHDLKARNASPEEMRQMRMNLVGAEATQRLENLDTQRDAWKNRVTDYLGERDQIQKSGMSDTAKQQAIKSLQAQQFTNSQDLTRLQTFETIHDQGGKLPFND